MIVYVKGLYMQEISMHRFPTQSSHPGWYS